MHLEFIRFGQYGYCSRRGMDTPLGLRHRHALHAVHTRFVFERTIDVLAHDVEDDLLVSAASTFAEGRDRIFEAFHLEILGVHTEEVAGKDRRFVSTRTATDLHDDVLAIFGILGQELELEFFLELRDLRFELIDLSARHLLHIGIGLVVKEVLGFLQIFDCFLIAMRTFEHPLQVMVVTIQPHIPRLIGNDRRVRNEQRYLVELRF